MNLPKRIAFFSVGFIIGIILLFVFLGGKRASCAYFPSARVLKSIRKKEPVLSSEVKKIIQEKEIDTGFIKSFFEDGDILFSESNIKQDSCNVYVIKGEAIFKEANQEKPIKIWVKNCTKVATIQKLEIIKKE